MSAIVKMFLWFQAVAATIWLLLFFGKQPLLLCLVSGVAVIIALAILAKEAERKKNGYWVEYISPGVLRADEDEFALVYHDKAGDMCFTGTEKINFPSPKEWERKAPIWAKGQRQLIIDRVCKHYPQNCATS